MSNIIPIHQNHSLGVSTVDARELHAFLEVGKRFTTWVQDRIQKYGFIEGQDFLPELGKSIGGRPSTEYHLTLDMAKELAMVENNEKGREARRFFIEAEKKLRSAPQIDMTNPRNLLAFAEAQIARAELAEAELEKALPSVAAVERLSASEGSVNLTKAAKQLDFPPRRFTQYLGSIGWIYKRAGSKTWTAYQDRINKGYLEHKPYTYEGTDGYEKTVDQVMVTPRGLASLAKGLELPKAA